MKEVGPDRAPAARFPPLLHRVYLRGAALLRSHPLLYRVLFGHRPPPVEGQLWDWTTLTLVAALRRHLRPGASFLDMGTGPSGVLAIYAKNRLRCGRACGVDHVAAFLPTAAETARRCGVEVEFHASALFAAVVGRFDVIAFNAPYVPLDDARRLGADRLSGEERRWSGGATGTETIARFLRDAPSYLAGGGRILLGVNHFYLTPDAVREAVAASGLEEVEVLLHRFTGGAVYVLRVPQKMRAARKPLESSTRSANAGA